MRDRDDRYPSVDSDPRTFRSRAANRRAAQIALAALVLIIVLVALFA